MLVSKDAAQDASRGALYDAVSSRIGQRLRELKVQADLLALEHQIEVEECRMHDGSHGYVLWQQVDWEAFGMGTVMSSDADGSQIVKRVPDSQQNKPLEKYWDANSSRRKVSVGFSYEGGIMSRVRGYVNPAEFMGFAARGLYMNGRLVHEGVANIQEAGPVGAWRQFVNNRLSDEGRFSIQESGPVKAWKQFVRERLSDEGRFSVQGTGPVQACKQFLEGSVSRFCIM